MDPKFPDDRPLRLTLGRLCGDEDWDRLARDAARRQRALDELAERSEPRPAPGPVEG